MERDELFQTFHRYRRLCRRGLAQPLIHNCGGEYYTSMGAQDSLVLVCNGCGTPVVPGMGMIHRIEAVVKRNYE